MTVRIMIGDALSQLAELPDESVHCVMTSPPYWGLRAYKGDTWDGGNPACDHQRSAGDISTSTLGGGKATVNHAREGWPRGICGKCGATMTGRMIGLEPTFDAHLENLVAVFREVRRVLRSDGVCFLNYGDAYTSGGRATYRSGVSDNKGHQIQNDMPRPDTPSGLKPKDLMMMPARVAMALQADGVPDPAALRAIQRATEILIDEYGGSPPAKVLNALDRLDAEYAEAKGRSWWLRSEIIWHKSNPMPESVRDRPTCAHEKVFLLSKSARYFYDSEAVRVLMADSSISRLAQNIDGQVGSKRAHEGRKSNGNMKAVGGKQRGHERRHDGFNDRWDAMTKDEQQSGGANLRNVWKVATHSFSEAHFATFPPALVEPCIKAGTSEHGVCGQCGAPWARVVDISGGGGNKGCDASVPEGTARINAYKALGGGTYLANHITTGWSPTCDHDAAPVPATCLDPFAGAGTVGIVADRLQRDAILIEISPDYAKMAQRRIEADAGGLFSSVVVG